MKNYQVIKNKQFLQKHIGDMSHFGSVVIIEGIMCRSGASVEEMTHNLDSISNLKLYRKLHKKEGKSVEIFKTKFYLN